MNCMSIFLLVSTLFGASSLGNLVVIKTNETFLDRAAQFGPSIQDTGVPGFVIDVTTLSPTNEDQTIYRKGCVPVQIKLDSPWIALVERGNCSFIEKVRAMQNSGASAVIIGDDMPRIQLTTMFASGDTSDVFIPSVFIAQWTYQYLLYQIETNLDQKKITFMDDNREIKSIAQEYQQRQQEYIIGLEILLIPNDYQLPLVEMMLILILAPIALLFAFYGIYTFTDWVKQKRAKYIISRNINTIPTKTFFLEKRKENEPETCAICLEDFQDEDEVRTLPCRHEYHTQCVDPWIIERSRLCPICKQEVLLPSEDTPLIDESIP